MENRHGLIVGATATRTSGHSKRLAAQHQIAHHADRAQRVIVGADKGFHTQDFVAELREINVTPHAARNDNDRRSAAIDGGTTHTLAMRSACACASASRRRSVGPRRWPACARRAIVDCLK